MGLLLDGLILGIAVEVIVGTAGMEITHRNCIGLLQPTVPPESRSCVESPVGHNQPTDALSVEAVEFQLLHVKPVVVIQSEFMPKAWLMHRDWTVMGLVSCVGSIALESVVATMAE